FNVALFDMLEKDAASGLNGFELGDQRVFVANLYRQDTIKKGFTVEISYHYNHDDPKTVNGPTLSRFTTPREIKAHYIGFAADGHLGERLPWIFGKIGGGLNLSTAFYQAFGKDEFNSLAGRDVDINAQLAFAEASVDRDWLRFRSSFLYAS